MVTIFAKMYVWRGNAMIRFLPFLQYISRVSPAFAKILCVGSNEWFLEIFEIFYIIIRINNKRLTPSHGHSQSCQALRLIIHHQSNIHINPPSTTLSSRKAKWRIKNYVHDYSFLLVPPKEKLNFLYKLKINTNPDKLERKRRNHWI